MRDITYAYDSGYPMIKITTQQLLDLMPLVAYQEWKMSTYGTIRNEVGQCPICALSDLVLDRPLTYKVLAGDAMCDIVGNRDSRESWQEAVEDVVSAADDVASDYRQALMDNLYMSET